MNKRVVIIDDHIKHFSPIVVRLGNDYKVDFFTNPDVGLKSISENIGDKQVVILDLDLGNGVLNGHELLEKLREKSFLIPVIIWSAKDETQEGFSDLINNKAFAFVPQNEEDLLLQKVNEAFLDMESNVDVALEKWLEEQPDKEGPYLITSNGKEYSIEDVIREIRSQSVFGKEIEQDILMLTIDLLHKKKKIVDG